MSRRSRSAPGNVQGRSKTSVRFKSAITTKRIDEGKRAAIHEIGNERRASVYRTDVAFAPEDKVAKLPKRGTPERAELTRRVVELRRTGLSHHNIGYKLDPMISATTVANLLREAGEK